MKTKIKIMKREIIFRGLRTDEKGWAYGNLINWHPTLKPRIVWFEQQGETSEELDLKETNYEVIPESVGQFTGLHDKNGKKIYEGDVLKGISDVYINGFNTPVEFYKGSFNTVILYDMLHIPLFDYETVWMKNGFKGETETCLWISEFEIIGNIHATPELLNN